MEQAPPDHNREITIAGAGPAGLAAAITLARAGRRVCVHETHADVGHRFQGDFQGLENWTTDEDVLTVFESLGITTAFRYRPFTNGTAFDAWNRPHPIHCQAPLFYLIERGPAPGSLDKTLLEQALSLGVEVRFNSRLQTMPGPGVLAIGPRAADAMAVGYHFETDMADGYWAICDNDIAPGGYAYLLIWNGRGTVKTCMFHHFDRAWELAEKTVARFRELTGLEMRNPVRHGGIGNFLIPQRARSGRYPVAGEQAGFQDMLWGFGIRHAIQSGILAARSLLDGSDYDRLWKGAFGKQLKVSLVNRVLFNLAGNRGYRLFLARQSRKPDVRAWLRKHYNASFLKLALYPLLRRCVRSNRKDLQCKQSDCDCVWCKHATTETERR